MQFNDIWLMLANATTDNADNGWVNFWYRWIVYLAFAYTILVLLVILLRNLVTSLPSKDQRLANTITWITSLSLLLIIPSLLVRILPGFTLRLAGLENTASLQHLSFDNIEHIVAILRHLCWQGTLGFAFILVMSGHAATRRLLMYGPGQLDALSTDTSSAAGMRLPVQIIDELTPVPIDPTISAEPSPGYGSAPATLTMTADEVTLIPSPSLPLAAWLRSLSYKGGNNQIFELSVEQTDIGRQTGHITLNADLSISGKHATIYFVNASFLLEDHSRYHSTWVNELQLEKDKKVPLRDGDLVRFGESRFSFNVLAWPEIEFLAGQWPGKVIKQQPVPILIGAGLHNHIPLQEANVADVHARIELDYVQKSFILKPEQNVDPATIVVATDNHTEEAPVINDPPWVLTNGARFRIGDHIFRIHYVQPDSAAAVGD